MLWDSITCQEADESPVSLQLSPHVIWWAKTEITPTKSFCRPSQSKCLASGQSMPKGFATRAFPHQARHTDQNGTLLHDDKLSAALAAEEKTEYADVQTRLCVHTMARSGL